MWGLVGHGEDLGLFSKSGGSHGGFRAQEDDARTQELTGALWRLCGGTDFRERAIGGRVRPGYGVSDDGGQTRVGQ